MAECKGVWTPTDQNRGETRNLGEVPSSTLCKDLRCVHVKTGILGRAEGHVGRWETGGLWSLHTTVLQSPDCVLCNRSKVPLPSPDWDSETGCPSGLAMQQEWGWRIIFKLNKEGRCLSPFRLL